MRAGTGRVARGFKSNLCGQCEHGKGMNEPALFDPRCSGCADKKARGLRTGNEPAPKHRLGEKWIDYTKQLKQLKARAKYLASQPGYR